LAFLPCNISIELVVSHQVGNRARRIGRMGYYFGCRDSEVVAHESARA
jgi:hypothetical protein